MTVKSVSAESLRIPLDHMPALQEILAPHTFRAGQFLFYAGHMPYGIFVLADGLMELEYPQQSKHIVKPQALLGGAAYALQQPYKATARAVSHAKVYFLSNEVCKNLRFQGHVLAKWLEEMLAPISADVHDPSQLQD